MTKWTAWVVTDTGLTILPERPVTVEVCRDEPGLTVRPFSGRAVNDGTPAWALTRFDGVSMMLTGISGATHMTRGDTLDMSEYHMIFVGIEGQENIEDLLPKLEKAMGSITARERLSIGWRRR